ncbi:MAG: sporulation protein YtfJ [Firmicutes bacterium]|nr:sporulation protein YtfJ [Bacillota bacterium]
MHTVMDSLKEMVDVNTILGDPVETPDGAVIVPVSRVSFGFAAGGTDQPFVDEKTKDQPAAPARPFGGGSGAGISVKPVAFLVVREDEIRLMSVDGNAIYDRLLDLAPKLVEQVRKLFGHETCPEKPAWVYDGGGHSCS